MNETNELALRQLEAKKILAELANVPDEHDPRAIGCAQTFLDRYGPLRSNSRPEAWRMEVIGVAHSLRYAWSAQTEIEAESVNDFLDSVFAPATAWKPGDALLGISTPAIRSNFALGRWEPVPRHLLDVLAIELMRSRKMLHRCEKTDCQRYFIKDFSRDRYCSVRCSGIARRLSQSEWARNRRHAESVRQKSKKKH